MKRPIRFLLAAAVSAAVAHGSSAADYRCFYANLHAHCGYSDGRSTPDTAFAYARDVALVHVQALTDHNNGGAGYTISPAQYANVRLVADTITRPGAFVALAGQEIGSMGSGGFGHLNVWEVPELSMYYNTQSSLVACYQWIASQQRPAQFNHPGAGDDNNFNNLHYYPEFEPAVGLLEVFNQDYTFTDQYLHALAAGWQIGATGNQDNHYSDWGNHNGTLGVALTGIWADTLTKPAILDALRSRRTFALRSKPAAGRMQLSLLADGHWMGERYLRKAGAVALEIDARSPDSSMKRLDLYSDGELVDSLLINQKVVSWRLSRDVGTGAHYFLVKVSQGGGGTAWSSPAFVEVPPEDDEDKAVTWPTPVNEGARVVYRPIDGVTRVAVDIYNLAGARVWRSVTENPAASIYWDGRDSRGVPMPNGVYVILVEQQSPTQTKLTKGKTMVAR
ncbi:MAG: CehA/McbA family metallohydrolase [Candidatus Edwardsbacteria bacterium]|jgi:predicted metal-dependent phosphoesterase TrpH|nr:CehA/McbA family metallohydrolase [Candidatus Edwardsbacteria bacterium]